MSVMSKLSGNPYEAKIAECYAMCDAVDDPLAQAVYLAMASEFEGRAAVVRAKQVGIPASIAAPPLAALRMVRQAR